MAAKHALVEFDGLVWNDLHAIKMVVRDFRLQPTTVVCITRMSLLSRLFSSANAYNSRLPLYIDYLIFIKFNCVPQNQLVIDS